MIIVKVIGGMGNQMFQYALYTALSKNNKCKLDICCLDKYLSKLGRMSIFQLFDLSYEESSKIDNYRLGCFSFIDRLRKKFHFFPKRSYIKEKNEGSFDISIFNMDDVYLDGYWQSFKYFDNIRDEILNIYKFPSLDKKNLEYKSAIEKYNNSVSIHLRMGDYLSSENEIIFGNICTKDYYVKAIKYLKDRYEDCHFFIFSNETKIAKRLFDQIDENLVTFVENNDEYNGWKDMYLMSLCRFNIIANSSFSWWGAWLNQNNNKLVIAPKKWLNTCPMPDICPSDWIRL